ncbi:DUF6318 family protein [Blastococcus sp. SYSU D00813]
MSAGWTARTTAALAVAAAVLSGCSDEQPANDSLPEPSTQASESEDALPPLGPPEFPVPDEARQKTPEGALAFTQYYIALIEYTADHTADPQPLLELSSGCGTCTRIAQSFADDRAAGNVYDDVTIQFTAAGPGILTGGQADVGFVLSQSAVVVRDAQGSPVEDRSSEATTDLQSGALLEWRADWHAWLITTLTIG